MKLNGTRVVVLPHLFFVANFICQQVVAAEPGVAGSTFEFFAQLTDSHTMSVCFKL